MRALLQTESPTNGRSVPADASGRSIFFRPTEPCSVDSPLTHCWKRYLRDQNKVLLLIYVGANTGQSTFAFLHWAKEKGNKSCMIHSFEPGNRTIGILRDRFKEYTQSGRLRIHHQALSNSNFYWDSHVLQWEQQGPRKSSVEHPWCQRDGPWNRLGDNFRRLSQQRKAHRPGRVYENYTEGYDLPVMQGAPAALRGHRIRMLTFEYGAHWGIEHNSLRSDCWKRMV